MTPEKPKYSTVEQVAHALNAEYIKVLSETRNADQALQALLAQLDRHVQAGKVDTDAVAAVLSEHYHIEGVVLDPIDGIRSIPKKIGAFLSSVFAGKPQRTNITNPGEDQV